jgi:LysM repeat protein
MSGLEGRLERGSTTSDFIIFATVFMLSFVIGSLVLGTWVYATEPIWLRQRWDVSSDLASHLSGAKWLSLARWSTTEGELSETQGRETYTVRPGDTLSEIALTHAVTMSQLVSLNGIEDPDILRVGRLLSIRETRRGVTESSQRPATSDLGTEREPKASAVEGGLQASFADVIQSGAMALNWLVRGSRIAPSLPRSDAGGDSAEVLPPDPAVHVSVATASAPTTDFATVDELAAMAEEQLRTARFQAALETAGKAIRLLQSDADSAEANSRRVTLELVRAEAHVAFGDSKAARRSFERALDADPDLALDPDRTSPKVLRSFDRARSHQPPLSDSPGSDR